MECVVGYSILLIINALNSETLENTHLKVMLLLFTMLLICVEFISILKKDKCWNVLLATRF